VFHRTTTTTGSPAVKPELGAEESPGEVPSSISDDDVHLLIACWMCLLAIGTSNAAAFTTAHLLRQRDLKAARRGEATVVNTNGCLLCCFGAPVVYYWEGLSMSCVCAMLFPGFALCCWRRAPGLLENGSPVLVVAPSVPVVTARAVPPDPPQAVAVPVLLGQIAAVGMKSTRASR